ncbi:MAG: beta-ketoacyl-ACP synthase II [Chloroflexi bacterium]|nr:beta-ketoacyl-ACP synthase II [Chloroflexota bacterium]
MPGSGRRALRDVLDALEHPEHGGQLSDALRRLRRALHQAGWGGFLPRRRVVITGMGAITPVGHSVEETWENLVAGKSGIDYVTRIDVSDLPTRIAAEVKDFDPTAFGISKRDARRMARASQYALAAAQQAVEDAGIESLLEREGDRAGVVMGTGLGGFDLYENLLVRAGSSGRWRVRPMDAIGGLPNIPAFHISERFGLRSVSETVVTACASGTQALGNAAELIRHGILDVALAGGVEGLIVRTFFVGFSMMKALSTRNDPPHKASRPFDATRDGFVIGEGTAVFVLESLEHALQRGARIYAEILGHSATSDAYHMAAPDPEGRGAQLAMQYALEDAGIRPEDVDYINAHGTSTPLNDKTETLAIKRVFGEHAYNLAVNSTKSMLGHAFGGAGAIEALAVVKSILTGILHPTINYEHPDPECDLDYVPNEARRVEGGIRIGMSNSFGLGGQNASIIIGRFG